jgi:hypothetical protein
MNNVTEEVICFSVGVVFCGFVVSVVIGAPAHVKSVWWVLKTVLIVLIL